MQRPISGLYSILGIRISFFNIIGLDIVQVKITPFYFYVNQFCKYLSQLMPDFVRKTNYDEITGLKNTIHRSQNTCFETMTSTWDRQVYDPLKFYSKSGI